MQKIGVLITTLLLWLFCFCGIAEASYTTYTQSGGSYGMTDAHFDYLKGKGYDYIFDYTRSGCVWCYPDQTTLLMKVTFTGSPDHGANSEYISIYDGFIGSYVATSNSLSVTYMPNGAAGGFNECVTFCAGLYFLNPPSTMDTKFSYVATFNTYSMDGYSSYLDSNGYVHFVITQNTPNPYLSYSVRNSTTNNDIVVKNMTAKTFEIVDTNPKPGIANNYSISISSSGYGCGAYQYQGILINIPGDIATYDILTQGANGDGKTLDTTYDQANAANSAAQSANTYAQQASSNAANANTNASNASTRSWYSGKYGGTQQSVADVTGYIANNQLPGISSKIDSLSTVVNNLSGGDKTPPEPYLQTVSGAMATSGSSIKVVLKIFDPDDTSGFTYSLDKIYYNSVPQDNIITLPVNNFGENVIWVWVKDQAGNVGANTILIRKLY